MANGSRRQSLSTTQRRQQKDLQQQETGNLTAVQNNLQQMEHVKQLTDPKCLQQQERRNQLILQKEDLIANRQYKDTIFRMLFSDKKNLLSLYNAVNNSTYQNPEELEIVTLENAVYMG